MFCLNCGTELDNNAKFCPYCGTVVGANAPQYTPPQYTSPQYTPTQYNPTQYDPTQYDPTQYTPTQYDPTQYDPTQYTPTQYNSAQYNPIQYNPTQYSQSAGPAYIPSGNYGNTGAPNLNPKPQRARLSTRSKVLIGAAAVAVVVAAVIGIIFSGVFASDKSKVLMAATKTASAFANAAKSAELPDLNDLIESQKFSQSGEIALEDIDLGWYGIFLDDDLSVLEGIGVRFSTNYDLSGEKLSASVTPFYGSADLLTAQLVMDGSKVYVNSPELAGSTYYGLDTMTLGRDLRDLGADEDVVGNLSFNIFQLVQRIQEITETDDESLIAIADAGKKLYDAIEVDKNGTETVRVNGSSVKCDAYTVVIPKSAMKDYLRAARSAVSNSVDYRRDLIDLFSSIGLPDEMVDELEDELSYADPKQSVRTMFSGLEDVVDELGDVELQVYISKGYIMAVTFSKRIDDVRVKAELNLGGGTNYVDNLRLVVSLDNDYSEVGIELTSRGDHSAKSGTFKDETVLEITAYGETVEFSSEMSYAPKKGQNNFSWSIDFELGRLEMEGQLTTGKNSMELHLEELKLRADDVSVTLRVDYSAGPYQSIPSVTSSVMVLTLDEDELRDIAEEIRDNARDWAYDLIDKIPEMENFFGSGGTSDPAGPAYPAP